MFLGALILLIPFLYFYNLDVNPRTWQDEGSYLLVAKTLVEDGQYAIRSSDGYQTFGAVQSVGPTVLLPVALSFKLFGVGLLQGRLVAAVYSLLTLVCFYLAAKHLFDRRTALAAVIILLSAPSTGFLLYGRQVLGEIPAFGFFLAGWLLFMMGAQSGRKAFFLLSGLCFGLAVVTKNQYWIILTPTLILIAFLDLIYYRTKLIKPLLGVLVMIGGCYAAWWGWQYFYYGAETFRENWAKLSQLGAVTTYMSLDKLIPTARHLVGSGSGHTYIYWGFPAIVFMGGLSIRRGKEGFAVGLIFLFTVLWLLYMIFWSTPWNLYYLAPMALSAIFIARIGVILANNLAATGKDLYRELRQWIKAPVGVSMQFTLSMGSLIALLSFGLWTGYQLQTRVRDQVLDRIGIFEPELLSALHYQEPHQLAKYLNENIDKNKLIETWEREVGVLADHRFHYPDQSFLADSYFAVFRQGQEYHQLGKEYFAQVRPDYIVVGWYGRVYQLYDFQYIAEHAESLVTIGEGDWRYEVYALKPEEKDQ